MSAFSYGRIIVIGVTSSGKSTLAKALAERLRADFIELDALHWEPNWLEAPDEVFRERVEIATNVPAWVAAGNYDVVRDILWPRAEVVIWLDYPFHIVFWQLLKRTIRRAITQERIFSGNVEKFSMHLKVWSEESLIHWLFKSYPKIKRKYPMLLALPENAHLRLIHLKHPRETARWLEQFTLS